MYNLGDIPRIGARNFPHREAIVHKGIRFTYLEFNKRIKTVELYLIYLKNAQRAVEEQMKKFMDEIKI